MPNALSLRSGLTLLWASIALAAMSTIAVAGQGLSTQSLTLVVFAVCCLCWALGRWTDLGVAMAGLAALAALGAVDPSSLQKWLGHDTIWLIVGAFVMSGVLQATGVAQTLAHLALHRISSVRGLFIMMSATVALTAFLIPSTSARAALFVPVFLALASAIPNQRIVRSLALLIPTIILFSAGASLTGAAAHVMAMEMAASANIALPISFFDWAILAVPPTIVICAGATALVAWLFLNPADRREKIVLHQLDVKPVTQDGWRALTLAGLTIGLWGTTHLHGLPMGVVAMIMAATMTLPGVTGVNVKQAFKCVEWELILFMIAVLAMGGALASSGSIAWIASATANMMAEGPTISLGLLAAVLIVVAMAGHLIVVSRTARVAVILPACAFPAIALGLDPITAVMTVALGTGFCQTMTASAKPVAVFSRLDAPTYSAADLLKLSAVLALPFAAILWACIVAYWPLVLTPSL